jgi:hypothetical protein
VIDGLYRSDMYGCRLWIGRMDKTNGYPLLWVKGKALKPHKLVWEDANGPVPEGMEIDHVCRRRKCVRLEHLELVTRSENEKRKHWRHRTRRVLCAKGHDLYLNGRITPEGGKVCMACVR